MSDYDLQRVTLSQVRCLCEQFHGYESAGNVDYCFGVLEGNSLVAGYSWQPPAPGAARSVCPEAPQGVLALSRMVAVPKDQRRLNHVSRPLRRQMKHLIDRTRWPVLVTYSDEGQGHTGHVYKCSGWTPTTRKKVPIYANDTGGRASRYSNGKTGGRTLIRIGSTFIQRWEHWISIVPYASVAEYMAANGWRRVPKPGKVWRSGNQAFTYIRSAA